VKACTGTLPDAILPVPWSPAEMHDGDDGEDGVLDFVNDPVRKTIKAISTEAIID
jgi:hypothetical protein